MSATSTCLAFCCACVLSVSPQVLAQETQPPSPSVQPAPSAPGGVPQMAPDRLREPEPWQREAQRPQRDPPFTIDFSIGGGRFKHRTDGSNLDDSTTASYARLRFEGVSESGLGGGLRLEGIGTDDDLFRDTGLNPQQASVGELFLFGSYRDPDHSADFVAPLRFGVFFHGYELEDQITGNKIDYSSVGVKVEVEPEFTLMRHGSLKWSLYGAASLGAGPMRAETTPKTFKGDDSTVLFGLDIGTRLRVGHGLLSVGYVLRTESIGQTDDVNGSHFNAVKTEFNGLELSFGVTF